MADQAQANDRRRVPIAAIGASAGGIKALQSFFEELPAKVGAAFALLRWRVDLLLLWLLKVFRHVIYRPANCRCLRLIVSIEAKAV